MGIFNKLTSEFGGDTEQVIVEQSIGATQGIRDVSQRNFPEVMTKATKAFHAVQELGQILQVFQPFTNSFNTNTVNAFRTEWSKIDRMLNEARDQPKLLRGRGMFTACKGPRKKKLMREYEDWLRVPKNMARVLVNELPPEAIQGVTLGVKRVRGQMSLTNVAMQHLPDLLQRGADMLRNFAVSGVRPNQVVRLMEDLRYYRQDLMRVVHGLELPALVDVTGHLVYTVEQTSFRIVDNVVDALKQFEDWHTHAEVDLKRIIAPGRRRAPLMLNHFRLHLERLVRSTDIPRLLHFFEQLGLLGTRVADVRRHLDLLSSLSDLLTKLEHVLGQTESQLEQLLHTMGIDETMMHQHRHQQRGPGPTTYDGRGRSYSNASSDGYGPGLGRQSSFGGLSHSDSFTLPVTPTAGYGGGGYGGGGYGGGGGAGYGGGYGGGY